jgi:hypothetical protein
LLTSQAYTAQDTKLGLKGLESRFSPFATIPGLREGQEDLHASGRILYILVQFCMISNTSSRCQTFLSASALLTIPRSRYQLFDNATMCLAQLCQTCNDGASFTGFTYTAQDIRSPSYRDRD